VLNLTALLLQDQIHQW